MNKNKKTNKISQNFTQEPFDDYEIHVTSEAKLVWFSVFD